MSLTASLKNRIYNRICDDRGSVAPIFGLMAMPLLFTIALSFEQAEVNDKKARLQFALDAAALAAMSNAADSASSEELNGIARKYFAANFTEIGDLPYDVTVTKTEAGEVNATATASVPVNVAALLGYNTIQISATSLVEPQHEVTTEGEVVSTSENIPCIHVMDQNGTSFEIDNAENLDAKDCIVHVRSNKGNFAMEESGGSNVQFKRIRVKGTGTYTSGLVNGSSVVTNDYQVTGSPFLDSIRDVKQAINGSIGNCTEANTNKTLTGTVSPGTYCGTTEFKDATFQTGLYIIKTGSVSVTSNSQQQVCTKVKGKTTCTTSNVTSTSSVGGNGKLKLSGLLDGSAGVTFYLADNSTSFDSYSANENSVLRAPTSGTTRGILFFEDSNRGQMADVTFSTCKKNSWQGLVYLPSFNVTLQSMENWDQFDVSWASNQLYIKNWDNMTWTPYAWTPFNMSSPVTLDGEEDTVTDTQTTYTEIYLKQ